MVSNCLVCGRENKYGEIHYTLGNICKTVKLSKKEMRLMDLGAYRLTSYSISGKKPPK